MAEAENNMAAYLSVEIEERDVVELLTKNHGLEVGDAVGRLSAEFSSPTSNGRQTVTVSLTYALSREEIDQLIR